MRRLTRKEQRCPGESPQQQLAACSRAEISLSLGFLICKVGVKTYLQGTILNKTTYGNHLAQCTAHKRCLYTDVIIFPFCAYTELGPLLCYLLLVSSFWIYGGFLLCSPILSSFLVREQKLILFFTCKISPFSLPGGSCSITWGQGESHPAKLGNSKLLQLPWVKLSQV